VERLPTVVELFAQIRLDVSICQQPIGAGPGRGIATLRIDGQVGRGRVEAVGEVGETKLDVFRLQ
jgi:hypothetical protein